MLYNKAIYEPVETRFNDKKIKARRTIDERRREIYTAYPEYKTIEDEISKLGIQLARVALGDDRSTEVDEIKNKINSLSADRKKILSDAGLPENYIYDVYECSKCSDTGYIDGVMCDCFKNELFGEIAKKSNIATALKNVTFRDFDVGYYSGDAGDNGRSPREQIMDILAKSIEFVENFGKENNKNLLFYGSPGLGKTFVSSAIANALASRGVTVMYYTSKQLLGLLTDNEFKSTPHTAAEAKWAHNVDLLIIDDLGTEHITSYSVASLFDILNSRMLAGKSIIINTNLSPKEIATIYSSRVFSRLTEFQILKFIGKDIRIMKTEM